MTINIGAGWTVGPGVEITPYIPTLAGSLDFQSQLTGGSGSHLAMSPGFSIGSGAYTIEGWFKHNGSYPSGLLGNFTGSNGPLSLFLVNSTTLTTDSYGGGGEVSYTVPTISDTHWYYFALVRDSSNNETVFIGQYGSATAARSSSGVQTNSINYTNNTVNIGTYYGTSWNGLVTNLRVVVGTAVYDPTQTSIPVPTAPLSVISGTELLLLGDSLTSDASGTQTLTVTPVISLQPSLKPF